MAHLPIKKYPDPVLKEKAHLVTSFDSKIKKLAEDMIETMYKEDGVGLAANQVGSLSRIFVLDVSENGDNPIAFINPEITKKAGKKKGDEGCLSIPGFREIVERSATVTVKAQDVDGKTFELEAEGLLSVCIQHELDHLDGTLFVDRLSHLKKQLFKKWLEKNPDFE
jgi:peptide deformylase